jgi:Phage integrase, N-terminal SAM-like domain
MAKRQSLIKQVKDVLDSLARFGESKHEEKQKKLVEAQAKEMKGWNPARVDGIYSIVTMQAYRRECIAFVEWAKVNYGCRYLEQCKTYIGQYLVNKIDGGNSAWSVQTVRSALRKLYQNPDLGNNVQIPIRKKNEIKRSRGEKAMDKKFSPERNRDLVDFCKATGLRRYELQAVKVQDFYRDEDGKLRVEVHQGKGGRPRSVPVLQSLESRVLEILSGKDLESQIIEKIPVRADIHSYRRDYASSYYKELSGGDYDCKNKDTRAIQLVSWALGHNRLDVVTRNYLG